jgi:hypothetical protein
MDRRFYLRDKRQPNICDNTALFVVLNTREFRMMKLSCDKHLKSPAFERSCFHLSRE